MSKAKKILLTTDETKIAEIRKHAKASATHLNNLIKRCEDVCKTTFNKDQRDQIRDNGIDFIKDYFKPKHQFPNADEAFNLAAIGIDLQPLENYFSSNTPSWRNYPIEQNDKGIFNLVGEPKQIEACYHYAETPRQIEAFDIATKISVLLNKAVKLDFINKREIHNVSSLGNIITTVSSKNEVVPNLELIKRLVR